MLTIEEKIDKRNIVRAELKGKVKHLMYTFLSKKEKEYPRSLTREDIIGVLAELIVDETKAKF